MFPEPRRLSDMDTSDLDRLLLDDHGRLKVVPAEVYASIQPWDKLRLWTHKRAFYGLPTTELVDFIRQIIGGRTAIEIGSGNGVLGRALGIPMTDNLCQQQPDVAMFYAMTGQPVIQYGKDVECLDALAAVRKYQPQVVVASWVTQYSDGSNGRPGSMYGVDEEAMLNMPGVETYILFGSVRNHSHKDICSRPHRVIQEPWMWSRAQLGDTALFVWG